MTEQTRTSVHAAGTSPRERRQRPSAGVIAAGLGLCLGLLALGPGLGRGYLLSYDMVFVPSPQFNAAVLGTSGTLPRAVPSDAVVAALARALPADVVQKLVLLAIFVLACAGAARLLSRDRLPAQLAAGVFYAWNPFVAERLILGQWALLLGYAGLPWVLGAAARPGLSALRRVPRLVVALLPAAVGGFAAMSISGLIALPAAARADSPARSAGAGTGRPASAGTGGPAGAGTARPAGAGTGGPAGTGIDEAASAGIGTLQTAGTRAPLTGKTRLAAIPAAAAAVLVVLATLVVLSLPWLIPALARQVHTSPAGVAAFAARADTPFGTAGSLIMLGGGWNAQTVPAGYGGALSALWLCVTVSAAAGFLLLGWRRWPGLGAAAALGLLIALLGALSPGRDLLRSMITWWPGFAVLRDGQQFIAPLALAEAVGFGLVVSRVLRPRRPSAAREGAVILAAAIAAVPVLLLPGLAFGAAGRLRPVQYPADWLAARRLINADPDRGRALLLPWDAYRRLGWNDDEALLDPWPRLLARQVVWNDGVQVGSLQIPPEDPSAIAISRAITSAGPLTPALQARGYRYVIVDAGFGPAGSGQNPGGKYPFRSRLPGCRVVLSGPGLVVYQIPA
jgi:hypothetical protein